MPGPLPIRPTLRCHYTTTLSTFFADATGENTSALFRRDFKARQAIIPLTFRATRSNACGTVRALKRGSQVQPRQLNVRSLALAYETSRSTPRLWFLFRCACDHQRCWPLAVGRRVRRYRKFKADNTEKGLPEPSSCDGSRGRPPRPGRAGK